MMATEQNYKSNGRRDWHRAEENLRKRLHKLFEAKTVADLAEQNSTRQREPEKRAPKEINFSAGPSNKQNINVSSGKNSITTNSRKTNFEAKAKNWQTGLGANYTNEQNRFSKNPRNRSNNFGAKPTSKQNNFTLRPTNRQENSFSSECSNRPKFPQQPARRSACEAQQPQNRGTKEWKGYKKPKNWSTQNESNRWNAPDFRPHLTTEHNQTPFFTWNRNPNEINKNCKPQSNRDPKNTQKRRRENLPNQGRQNLFGKKQKTEESSWAAKNNGFGTGFSDLGADYDSDDFSGSEYSFSNFEDILEDAGEDKEDYYSDEDEGSFADFDDDCSYAYEHVLGSKRFNDSETNYPFCDGESDDLVIHRGTAEKRDLKPSDGAEFSDDNDDAQVVELQEKISFKVIQQPEEYQRAALEKLSNKEISIKPFHLRQRNEVAGSEIASSEDCPQLVPFILNKSTKSESTTQRDQSSNDQSSVSISSLDVNEKYLNYGTDEGITSTDGEENQSHKSRMAMSADVIEATNAVKLVKANDNASKSDTQNRANLPDLLPSELLISKSNSDAAKEAVVLTKVVSKLSDDKLPRKTVTINEKRVNERVAVDENILNLASAGSKNEETLLSISGMTPALDEHYVESNNVTYNRSIFCNSIDSNYVLVLLRAPIYLYGTVKLTTIVGSIDIYGYAPRCGEELEVFSPRGLCSVQVINKPNREMTHEAVRNKLKHLEAYFSKVDLQNIQDNYSLHEDALILLKRNEQRKKLINTLRKYMNENLFPHMNSAQTERTHFSSECRLSCFINMEDESKKALKINPQWSQLSLQTHSKLMIIGGKSVGKSTLLRYLVNRNLAVYPRFLLIDLDIGQPELFVPQTISASLVTRPLLGPGFFLNEQPAKAFAVGHSNVIMCPHRYMLAVKELLSVCKANAEYTQLPWLVNTMGYNRGFGAELIAVVCEFLQPTDVVQLQSNKDINNFAYIMEPSAVARTPRNIFVGEEYKAAEGSRNLCYKLHVLNSAILQESRFKRDWEMSAKDVRYATILTRLSDALDYQAEWLTDCSPLSASLDNLKVISLLSGEYTREQLLRSIEANLVYLCRYQNENIVQCFGIGVVRAIDYHINHIYLLPALPYNNMSDVDCLAIGDMPLPTSMLTNQGPKVKNIAPFVYNAIEDNATKSIKQIYFRPMEFLSGKHTNII